MKNNEMLAKVKEFAFRQIEEDLDDVYFFFDSEVCGTTIAIFNPWLDDMGENELSMEESISHYGKENVEGFCKEVIELLSK